jgi:hypothetical protein
MRDADGAQRHGQDNEEGQVRGERGGGEKEPAPADEPE